MSLVIVDSRNSFKHVFVDLYGMLAMLGLGVGDAPHYLIVSGCEEQLGLRAFVVQRLVLLRLVAQLFHLKVSVITTILKRPFALYH